MNGKDGSTLKLNNNPESQIGYKWFTSTTPTESYYSTNIQKDKIYYLSATYDGTTAKIYLDGTLVSQTTVNAGIKSSINKTIWAIGSLSESGSGGLSKQFNGKVYSARVYNRALTQSEITSNYNNDVSRFGPFNKAQLPHTNETEPYIPKGFNWDGKTTLTEGLVIKDINNNEFTWVEVPKSITRSCSTDSEIETALGNYANTLIAKQTGYTDTWYSGCGETEANYNYKKSKMLNSIKMYGGFWVSTYEIGTWTLRTTSGASLTTAVSVKDAYPYNYVTVSQAESLSSGMNSGNYTSSLMFGIQWDLIMKYMQVKGGKTVAELTTDSTSFGNYLSATFGVTRGRYSTNGGDNWTAITSYTKSANSSVILTTGASERNKVLNIYDMAGNLWEWTIEKSANAEKPCIVRGGAYGTTINNEFISNKPYVDHITVSMQGDGFRATIY